MKYLLMIYTNQENWGHPSFLGTPQALAMSDGERAELSAQFEALLTEITESGELVAGVPLADPSTTKTARVRSGVPATTDGPFLEA